MATLNININNIKNITSANIEFPFDNGIYAIVGENGCGKSTIMLCLSQLIMPKQLNRLSHSDLKDGSFVDFRLDGNNTKWIYNPSNKWSIEGENLNFEGLYEGSLFYGTRFEDSTYVEKLINNHKIKRRHITDADEYVKEKMSYILHGNLDHYRTLKRTKHIGISEKILKLRNIPYFITVNNSLVSQYRMSSGECLLVSLLHFLYNSIVRRTLPEEQKALVLIDELELALHPIAVLRLMDFLKELVKEHSNLVVYLSTHSPEVIRTIPPRDLFKIKNDSGTVSVETNCYPSYLIRDLYSTVSPDFLLLVEDKLAQIVVERILSKYALRKTKLIHCIPVGGWQNVLKLHKELYSKKILGTNTTIVSILDGDIAKDLNKEQKKMPHLFLPIPSVEKFLYEVIKENKKTELKHIINDKYFTVQSLEEIVSKYNKGTMDGRLSDSNKNFYKMLISELESFGTKEDVFISGLCDDIIDNIDITNFKDSIERLSKQTNSLHTIRTN